MGPKVCAGAALLIFASVLIANASDAVPGFKFDRDTLWFANWTVWNYANGLRVREPGSRDHKEKTDRYTRRCFVMSRTVQQFFKFARFDPKAPPLTDEELARRVRQVTRRPPWHPALPPNERTVFPGYANLRQLSKARTRVLQNNLGLGWPTYARIGNARMVMVRGRGYQEKECAALNETLAHGEMFVAFLSDFPVLHINHSVLVYARKSKTGGKIDKYICYDPNHPDAPRELTWLADKREFNFEKDPEFSGGYTRVYQIYGKPLQ
jgi:hypothetical protein